jgi:hypothetical protein
MEQKHWRRTKADISRLMAAEMRFLSTEGKPEEIKKTELET